MTAGQNIKRSLDLSVCSHAVITVVAFRAVGPIECQTHHECIQAKPRTSRKFYGTWSKHKPVPCTHFWEAGVLLPSRLLHKNLIRTKHKLAMIEMDNINLSYTMKQPTLINDETIDASISKEWLPLHSVSPLETSMVSKCCAPLPAQKPLARSVRFSDQATEYKSYNPLLLEDYSRLWYSVEELHQFRVEVRGFVQDYRLNQSQLPRGLEIYSSGERLQHRWMTVQCIRSALRKGMNPDKVAAISRECSACSSEIGVLQAVYDYAAVYPIPESVLRDLPSLDSIPPTFPFAMRKRRQNGGDEQTSSSSSKFQQVNKRRRLDAPSLEQPRSVLAATVVRL